MKQLKKKEETWKEMWDRREKLICQDCGGECQMEHGIGMKVAFRNYDQQGMRCRECGHYEETSGR